MPMHGPRGNPHNLPRKGVADRDAIMEDMMASDNESTDPKMLIDAAIERIASYAENPDEVTPETINELLAMLQQASAALGGEDVESALPMGQGSEQMS